MKELRKARVLALAIPALIASMFSVAANAGDCTFSEGRGGLCGWYASEISGSRAFLDTVVSQGNFAHGALKPVIVDVRSIAEYRAGHPEHAVNVPYPYVHQYCTAAGRTADGACIGAVGQIDQDPVAFADYVESVIPDKNTPIYTLCRTGHRSVLAANVLADRGYTNVRNIWEGFVGINLTAPKMVNGVLKNVAVDLNHDGVLNDEDKNGWRYHLGLPYDTRLVPPLLYAPYAYLYYLDN